MHYFLRRRTAGGCLYGPNAALHHQCVGLCTLTLAEPRRLTDQLQSLQRGTDTNYVLDISAKENYPSAQREAWSVGTQTHPHEQAEVSLLTATLLLFITIIELTCAHFCILLL